MPTEIDRNLMNAIRSPIETALAEIAEKLEIQIKLGRGTYSAGVYGKFNLELSAISETGEIFTEEAAAYKLNAGEKGVELEAFDPDWLFKEFKYAKKTYKLMGFKTRAQKNNMVIHHVKTGKRYVLPSTHLLREFEKQYIDLDGWDLNRAAEESQVDIARALIVRGDDIEARDDIGATPLHIAAVRNALDVATLLIDSDADIEAKDNDDWTPLHRAAFNNSSDVARLLIHKGANWQGMDLNWMDEQHRPKETPKVEVERVLRQAREAKATREAEDQSRERARQEHIDYKRDNKGLR